MKKRYGYILLIVLALLTILAGSTMAQTITKNSDGYLITFKPDHRHEKVVYSTVSNRIFSDLTTRNLQDAKIPVNEMAIMWLIGKSDTTSVMVIYNQGRPVVLINGVDRVNGRRLPREVWAYNEIIPEIEKIYKEE